MFAIALKSYNINIDNVPNVLQLEIINIQPNSILKTII